MKTEHFMTSTDEGQQLHYITWEPDGAPKAVLQLIHGMEEYIDRYDELARLMAADGWAVIGHDHLGHGQSGRWERGFFTERKDGADVVIADIRAVFEEAERRWPGVPHFMMGHSMGSFFLRRYLVLHPDDVSGAVICGTGWYNALLTGSALALTYLVGTLCGWHRRSTFLRTATAPHAMAFRSEGEGAWLSRNPENVARFNADPLCGFGFTAGAYRDMYRNLLRLSRGVGYDALRVGSPRPEIPAAKNCRDGRFSGFPILVISGAEDSVGGTKAVHKVADQYRSLGFTDVEEALFANDRHEVLFEPDKEAVQKTIKDFLNRNL